MTQSFTHLHLHTQYSLMQGAIPIKALTKKLKALEYHACAITDHGNMFGAIEFYHALVAAEITPIIGTGIYVAKESRHKRDYEQRGPNAHQTILLCQNREGYRNLTYLSSLAYTEGKHYGFPRVDHELLEKYNENLIALSAGLNGELAQHILNGRLNEAKSLAAWYRDLFEGRYYIELQSTGRPEQDEVNPQLILIAQELNIPLVASNDCHYLSEEDAYAHYILELMGLQKRVTDSDIPPMKPSQLYLKSKEEMQETFASLPSESLSNTTVIADQCDLSLDNKVYYLPKFELPENETPDSYMIRSAKEGLEKRLENLFKIYSPEEPFSEFRKEYDDRLEFELNVIIQMEFPGYFLIVADFINWAKDNGIPVGPGRGSGAGSLVAYALRITDVDPLRFGLLFERFLNPDRISMPDFDIDFEVNGREAVIDYVRKKYGENNVCQISTFQSLGAKGAIRGVARVLDFPYSEADKIAKLIPDKLGINLEESIRQEPDLSRMELEGTENEQKLIGLAKSLEGLTTHLGTHAAGVIIMDTDIREVMPVCTGKEDSLQSTYTMKYAEDQGAVKFDFLGLLTLSNIEAALKLINVDRFDDPFDLEMIPMDDPLTFNLLCQGDTTGIFQLESSGMKKLVFDMQPSVFEDIVAIVALYRPGPLGSGMVEDFIQCKHGRKQIVYPHVLMEAILKETYGVMVYQEQIMQAVQVLAGFTLGQADLLRRAIGKKIAAVLTEQREIFVSGCLNNPAFVEGCGSATPEQKANNIFDLIDYFSGYGFNKSHTVAYGLISYQTAYLKAHFPVQFMAALLNCSMNNPDKVVNFISECREMGIEVLPPDVNQSVNEFTVSFLKYQLDTPGMTMLKGLGVPESVLQVLEKLEKEEFQEKEALLARLKELPGQEQISAYRDFILRASRIEAVRFGLNAVKNVGGNAVDAILEARDKKPDKCFTDIMDFMKTVDLSKVNSRVLETFVKCGAFDSLNRNRAQLLEVLEETVHIGLEFQRAEDPLQNSLFDLLSKEEAQNTETQIEFPEVKDWPTKQRLACEKEALGFYVSGHPLDRYESEIKKLAISTYDLREQRRKEGDVVSLAGIIISSTVRLSRKNEKFSIIKLEDLRGSIEIPIYAKLYEEVKELLSADEPILVTGRVGYRDDEVGLVADKIQLLSLLRQETCKGITIDYSEQQFSPQSLNTLRELLLTSPGDASICFQIHTPEDSTVKIELEENIALAPKFVDGLGDLFEWQSVVFEY
ncbi:MAG: DNA polymerase III subunit alpha [SAR324 cluster bacterium]|nr:DNA polymerase III subunit alpha [SAR324 cluster bacterium]